MAVHRRAGSILSGDYSHPGFGYARDWELVYLVAPGRKVRFESAAHLWHAVHCSMAALPTPGLIFQQTKVKRNIFYSSIVCV